MKYSALIGDFPFPIHKMCDYGRRRLIVFRVSLLGLGFSCRIVRRTLLAFASRYEVGLREANVGDATSGRDVQNKHNLISRGSTHFKSSQIEKDFPRLTDEVKKSLFFLYAWRLSGGASMGIELISK